MTLDELKTIFGAEDGYFYQVIVERSDLEILEDIDQPVSTIRGGGIYIRTTKPVDHENYVQVL